MGEIRPGINLGEIKKIDSWMVNGFIETARELKHPNWIVTVSICKAYEELKYENFLLRSEIERTKELLGESK